MYRVYNLTNRCIKFQGKVIEAYSSEVFTQIVDIITLSRLTNSGKARYIVVKNDSIKKNVNDVKDVDTNNNKLSNVSTKEEAVVEMTKDIVSEKVSVDADESVTSEDQTHEASPKRRNKKTSDK